MTPRLIYDNLYISGHTRGLEPIVSMAILSAFDITRVICVAPTPDNLLAQHMRDAGMRYDHIPMSDGKTVNQTQIRSLARELLLDRRKILVHCNAGRNRSPLVVAAVMIYSGWSPVDAITHIRNSRDSALANKYFEDFLLAERP